MVRIKNIFIVLFLILSSVAFGQDALEIGASIGVHFQSSKNTLRLAPGLGLYAAVGIGDFEIDGHLFVGSLFGSAFIIAAQGYYTVRTGVIDPRIGIFINCNFGSYMFFTESYSGSIRPMLPEFGIGIACRPFVLKAGNVSISFLEFSVGTTFEYFGRILIAECELFKIGILF